MDFNNIQFVIPCLFGLESFVKEELNELNIKVLEVADGRITCEGGLHDIARANLSLRCAERVLIRLSRFKAESFEDLYQGVKKIPFEDIIGKTDAFPVSGHSLRSKLASIPDCQKIIKKAIVDRLKTKYHIDWFEETGNKYSISFMIMKDMVDIMLDTSGEGLHKRGYREKGSEAPLKETLAAAIVKCSRYNGRDALFDPMCGSGTIAIEGAMIAANIAPGLKRRFAIEDFSFFDKKIMADERAAALDRINKKEFTIFASDIDPDMAALTLHNAKLAGVERFLKVTVADVRNFKSDEEYGTIICNPPYGERLLDRERAEELYKEMGKAFLPHIKWRFYIITPDEYFERYFGKKADKKRKLYNGMMKCDLYQYFKISKKEQ